MEPLNLNKTNHRLLKDPALRAEVQAELVQMSVLHDEAEMWVNRIIVLLSSDPKKATITVYNRKTIIHNVSKMSMGLAAVIYWNTSDPAGFILESFERFWQQPPPKGFVQIPANCTSECLQAALPGCIEMMRSRNPSLLPLIPATFAFAKKEGHLSYLVVGRLDTDPTSGRLVMPDMFYLMWDRTVTLTERSEVQPPTPKHPESVSRAIKHFRDKQVYIGEGTITVTLHKYSPEDFMVLGELFCDKRLSRTKINKGPNNPTICATFRWGS